MLAMGLTNSCRMVATQKAMCSVPTYAACGAKSRKLRIFLKFVCLEKKESTGAERARCQMQIQASLPKATGLLLHDALVGWLTGLGLKQRNSTTGGH